MSWELDDIDFNDYGVYVAKSSGVLNFPAIENQPLNWLDEDNTEYWHAIADQEYSDREISLNCTILADSYSEFQTKINTFYAAIGGASEKTLKTPGGTEIDCYLEKEIQLNRITKYLVSKQAGIFILSLTVRGDSKYKPIVVYKPDFTARETVYQNDFKLSQKIMGDDAITGTIEKSTMFTIQQGDYILYRTCDSEGTILEAKYFMFDEPEITKHSTNKFTCNVRFEHEFFKIRNQQMRFSGQSNFSYFATAAEVMAMVLTNINLRHPQFVLGDVDETSYMNHEFSNQSCLEVIKQIADTYDLEFGYDFILPSGDIEIYLKKRLNQGSNMILAYGKGDKLSSITKLGQPGSDFCTILYAEGSTKNLPADYGHLRLQMPVAYVQASAAARLKYGYIERAVNFDEIFPSRTGTVTSYQHIGERTEEEVEQFIVTDTSLDFDINNYLVPNTSAKIIFQNGDLAGMEFEIHKYDHATKKIWLIQYVDNSGNKYPNETLKPAVNNEYKLVDIYLPDYIDAAETALETKAQEYLNSICPPDFQYKVELTPYAAILNGELIRLIPGNIVAITDSDFSPNELSPSYIKRILSVDLDLNTRRYSLNLATRWE